MRDGIKETARNMEKELTTKRMLHRTGRKLLKVTEVTELQRTRRGQRLGVSKETFCEEMSGGRKGGGRRSSGKVKKEGGEQAEIEKYNKIPDKLLV